MGKILSWVIPNLSSELIGEQHSDQVGDELLAHAKTLDAARIARNSGSFAVYSADYRRLRRTANQTLGSAGLKIDAGVRKSLRDMVQNVGAVLSVTFPATI